MSDDTTDFAAGGGLLHRRTFLAGGAVAAAATALSGQAVGATIGDDAPSWMTAPGASFRGYGEPAGQESTVERTILKPYGDLAPGAGVALTWRERGAGAPAAGGHRG